MRLRANGIAVFGDVPNKVFVDSVYLDIQNANKVCWTTLHV